MEIDALTNTRNLAWIKKQNARLSVYSSEIDRLWVIEEAAETVVDACKRAKPDLDTWIPEMVVLAKALDPVTGVGDDE